MRDGLYESVITAALKSQIEAATDLESGIHDVDVADEVHVLTQHSLTRSAVGLATVKDSE